MREKGPPDPPMEVPTWFFTYTDVITLLMTFFVLLLTFATSEPEKFERMQIALFGGGGGTGIAGDIEPLEKDSVLIRERPRSSRMASRGSEMPPIHRDASTESLQSGLEGLDERPTVDTQGSYSFEVPLSLLIDEDSELSSIGVQYLRMFGRRLRDNAYDLTLEVPVDSNIKQALALCNHLVHHERVVPGRLGVGVTNRHQLSSNLRFVLTYNPPR